MSVLRGLLTEALHKHLRDARPDRKPDGWWHMSGLGRCPRQRVITRAGLELTPLRAESLAVFAFGDAVEKMACEAWRDFTMTFQGRVELPKLNARGTFDVLIFTPDGNALLDVKSASGKALEWKIREPSEEYRMQLTGYAMALEEGGATVTLVDEHTSTVSPRLVNQTGIFYVDKEYGNVHLDEFDWHEYVGKVETDLKDMAAHWEQYERSKHLPPERGMETIRTRNSKHVKSGRAAVGDLAPHPLCSPLYCTALNHCPIVRAWWDKKGADES